MKYFKQGNFFKASKKLGKAREPEKGGQTCAPLPGAGPYIFSNYILFWDVAIFFHPALITFSGAQGRDDRASASEGERGRTSASDSWGSTLRSLGKPAPPV